jgi:hypothetical protein
MIKFFRKIRQNLLSENKFRKYLIYAIGEIILVVIGILIALSINNWNERQNAKQFENKLFIELHKSVKDDISQLKNVIDKNRSYIASAEIVLKSIETDSTIRDSISHHLNRAFEVWKLNIKTSAYDNLKKYGMEHIKNNELRKSIISGYDGRAKYVDLMYERYDLFLYNVVEPKLAEQFQFKEIEENDYNLFPINNDSNNSQHTLKYLLRKSIRLQEQIIGAEIRLQKLFEKLDEDLKEE